MLQKPGRTAFRETHPLPPLLGASCPCQSVFVLPVPRPRSLGLIPSALLVGRAGDPPRSLRLDLPHDGCVVRNEGADQGELFPSGGTN